MKKLFILMITLVFVLGMAAPVMAMDTRMDKLTNGVKDVFSSPLVIVKHPMEKMDEDGGMGLFKGLLEMPFKFVDQLGHGLIEVVTFPVVE